LIVNVGETYFVKLSLGVRLDLSWYKLAKIVLDDQIQIISGFRWTCIYRGR